jgi:hypothetical protein
VAGTVVTHSLYGTFLELRIALTVHRAFGRDHAIYSSFPQSLLHARR